MKFKVLVTDRDQVTNPINGELYDDKKLAMLNSIFYQSVDIEADSENDALQKVLNQYKAKFSYSEVTAKIVE